MCETATTSDYQSAPLSAAGAANVPKLFDRKLELLKRAGAELVKGAIKAETTAELAAPVMSPEDYPFSFEGGIVAKARMLGTAIKAIHAQKKSSTP